MKPITLIALALSAGLATGADSFYKGPLLFTTAPSDRLMDISLYQALKITPKTIGTTDYIFVEAGGFSDKNPVGWKSSLIVMKRNSNS